MASIQDQLHPVGIGFCSSELLYTFYNRPRQIPLIHSTVHSHSGSICCALSICEGGVATCKRLNQFKFIVKHTALNQPIPITLRNTAVVSKWGFSIFPPFIRTTKAVPTKHYPMPTFLFSSPCYWIDENASPSPLWDALYHPQNRIGNEDIVPPGFRSCIKRGEYRKSVLLPDRFAPVSVWWDRL